MTQPASRPIVFAVDASYLTPLRIAIESLKRASGPDMEELRVIVLHEGLPEFSRQSLDLGPQVEWRDISLPSDIPLPLTEWISRAAYYRLLIANALPDCQSCLYLDADILVLDNVAELLARRMSLSAVAAVRCPQYPILGYGDALPCWRELGLPHDREYFNSGVMLLDLSACRDQRLFERAWEAIRERPECMRYWDQDALNLVADDDWERLDRCWNTFPVSAIHREPDQHCNAEAVLPFQVLAADERTARILHFAGPKKPWHADFPGGAARESYTEFLRRLDA